MVLWQEEQETVPVDDKRGSWYNICPSSTLASVVGLSAGAGAVVGKVSAAETVETQPAKVNAVTSVRILNIPSSKYYLVINAGTAFLDHKG
jgi:hypothetical protein